MGSAVVSWLQAVHQFTACNTLMEIWQKYLIEYGTFASIFYPCAGYQICISANQLWQTDQTTYEKWFVQDINFAENYKLENQYALSTSAKHEACLDFSLLINHSSFAKGCKDLAFPQLRMRLQECTANLVVHTFQFVRMALAILWADSCNSFRFMIIASVQPSLEASLVLRFLSSSG